MHPKLPSKVGRSANFANQPAVISYQPKIALMSQESRISVPPHTAPPSPKTASKPLQRPDTNCLHRLFTK